MPTREIPNKILVMAAAVEDFILESTELLGHFKVTKIVVDHETGLRMNIAPDDFIIFNTAVGDVVIQSSEVV